MTDKPEYEDLIDESDGRGVGLVLHEFEIRSDDEDNLFIYKQISREAAQEILEEMPHIVVDPPADSN